MGREVGAVAEVAAAAHHGQVDAGAAAGHLGGQDIDVLVAGRQAAYLHRLLVQHARQRADAVAQLGRLLELQRLGPAHHLRLQVVDHGLRLAEQETLGIAHVACVVVAADQSHARPRAALDLVQQARPRAVVEHRVLAGAQAEHLLHELDRLLHRPGVGVGAEIAVLAIDGAAEIGHARVGWSQRGHVIAGARPGGTCGGLAGTRAGDLQIGVALVVAEQDVEPRRKRLDEVILEQQRLGLAAHDGGLQPRDAADHVADARAVVILVQVAGDTLLQVACLADVEHLALGVDPAVDAGQARQRRHLGEQPLARRHACGGGVQRVGRRRRLGHRARF